MDDYARQIIGETGAPIIVARNLHGSQAGRRISPEELREFCVNQYGMDTVADARQTVEMEQSILSGKKWTGIDMTLELV